MENLGALAILLAFCFAIYAILGSLVGKWKQKPFLAVSGERAVYTAWALTTAASGLLLYALIAGDYRMAFVWAHSNKTMPIYYKIAAWWGGQEGSLLLWAFLQATYAAIVVFTCRRKFRDMMPYVISVLMATLAFFLLMIWLPLSPFQVFTVGKGIQDLGDGQGLNPLLQYWTMVIHPPMLYLGYVGFSVPFAFAIASLITRQPGDAWIHTTRRWTLITWLFQSTGIILGAGWAYSVLGWGGYWGWDPVENASLLPWITATAFPALGDDAGKEGHDEDLERRAGFGDLLPVHLRHLPDAVRRGELGARLCTVLDWNLFHRLHGHRYRRYALPDPGPPAVPEERSPPGKRGLARIELPVQQPDPAGQLLCGAVGHAVPGDLGSRDRRQDQRGQAVLRSHQHPDRPVPAVPDGRGTADCLAQELH